MDKLKEELKAIIVECVREELANRPKIICKQDIFNAMSIVNALSKSHSDNREMFRAFLQMLIEEE